MNSVMDDNKLLTLANGERIRLENYCALLFEVGNLSYASPATVSRAGMVYVDPKNLRFNPYWEKWVASRPEIEHEVLNVTIINKYIFFIKQCPFIFQEMYEKLIPPTITFILEGVDGTQQGNPLKLVINQTDLNMVIQFCNMFNAMFPILTKEEKDALPPQTEEDKEHEKDALECGFIEVS